MAGIELLTGHAHAAVTLGIVFVEAIALYVGYGFVTDVLGPVVERTFERA